MIKAVVFDFDGLLVDTEIVSFKVYKNILSQYGMDFQIGTYAREYSGCPEVENVAKLLRSYGLPMTFDTLFDLVVSTERELLKKSADLKPGARELLQHLHEHGYGIAVASSSLTDRAMKILNQHDIARYFTAFVFSEDITNGKPDPEIFLKAAEKLEVTPSECLVLEDSEAGIEAAARAGMRVICIPDVKTPGPSYLRKTEAVLNSLDEIIPVLPL